MSIRFWFFKIPDSYNSKRGKAITIGLITTYSSTFSLLYATWYSQYPQSKFHLFNDIEEWNQVDKCGHLGSAYYLSRWSYDLIRWTGKDNRSSALIGSGLAYGFLFTVEVFDGFSNEWGFSSGDLAANTAGGVLFLSQQLAWNQQRITMKFSYSESGIAKYNKNLLGENLPERLLKDYNAHTYWLSGNIKSFLKHDSKFPGWLNISIGYGANGMIGGSDNISDDPLIVYPELERYRQFYIAPDIDLTKINFKNNTLKSISKIFGFIKFPAPTIEYRSNGKWVFHPVYF